jgi:HPt (histidine-containing phosphotransfer) domain-containing protein
MTEDKLKDQFDFQYLKEVSGGDEVFLAQMIKVFKQEQRLTIEKMKAAVYNQDWEGLSKVAHKFRSSCAVMGMKGLSKLAEKLEFFGDNPQDGTYVANEFIELIDKQSSFAINYIQKNI